MDDLREKKTYWGLPYEGPPLDIKDSDPPECKPTMSYRFHAEQFDMSSDTDVRRYEASNMRIVKGEGIMSYEEREYDSDRKSWRILLSWTEVFYGPPENMDPQIRAEGDKE